MAAIVSPATQTARHSHVTPASRRRQSSVLTAFRHVDEDVRGLGVGGAARVVAGVLRARRADGQRRLRLGPRLREHGDAARRVVVDHARVVVPEHVLRRHRTLHTTTELQ